MNAIPKAPKHLSAESKSWWAALMSEYDLDDPSAKLILQSGLEALDRLRQAQAIVEREGVTQVDRFGQARAHPATVVERDSRSAVLAALKALHLDVEPLQASVGRPASNKAR